MTMPNLRTGRLRLARVTAAACVMSLAGLGPAAGPTEQGPAVLGPAVLGPAALAAQAHHFPSEADLELMARYLVEDGEAPGVALGVLEADGTTRIALWGDAGPMSDARDAGRRPLGPGSVFEIGSITKTFTATLLADMVLKGAVALDDPVAMYLPEGVRVPSRDGREITLLDLATHRSGLPTVPDDFDPPGPGGADAPYTVEEAYAFLSRYELPRAPGAAREYSNFGFGLLGHALGRAVGSSYRELVRERILEPLGMRGTGFFDAMDPARLARGHRRGEPVRFRSDMEIFDGAGALYSTVEDLLTYMKAHVGPPASELEKAMRLATEIRVAEPGQEGAGHGLAWGTMVFPGETPLVSHGGGTAGFTARLFFAPASGIGIVVLANDAFFDDAIAPHLLYPDPPPPEWQPVDVAPEVLAAYAGTYEATGPDLAYYVRLEPGDTTTDASLPRVREDNAHLTYQPEGLVRARLYARSDSTFYLLRAPWSLTFRRDGDGALTMLMESDEREPDQAGARRVAFKVADDTPPSVDVAGNLRRGMPWMSIGVGVLGLAALLLVIRRARRRRTGAGARR